MSRSIEIYIEGGGDGADGKRSLRLGFDALLQRQKSAARERGLRWKIVMRGSRHKAFDAFRDATSKAAKDEIIALLVDAEGTLSDTSPKGRVAHLTKRDGWDLTNMASERVHLMVQCMEAWIVADPEILANYYGQDFSRNALSSRQDLEDEPNKSLCGGLAQATRRTQKGEYKKIQHASDLLQKLRPEQVAARCPCFGLLTRWLDEVIGQVQ